MGQEQTLPASKRDVPKTIEVPDVKLPDPKDAPKVKEGEETIDVAGTKVACKTYETTTDANGMKSVTKTWISNDIPGRTARMDQKSEGKIGDVSISSTSKITVTKWGKGA